MVIVSILMAAAVMSYRSAQRNVRQKGVASAAHSYEGAVSQFALDHTGRVPIPGTTQSATPGAPDVRDWPIVAGVPDAAGPRQPSLVAAQPTGPAYMKEGVPEPISGSDADLVYSTGALPAGVSPGAALPATGKNGIVVYRVDTSSVPAVRFRVEAWMATATGKVPATPSCWFGNWPIGTEARHEC